MLEYFNSYAETVMSQLAPGPKDKMTGAPPAEDEKILTLEQFRRLCMENELFEIKEKNDP